MKAAMKKVRHGFHFFLRRGFRVLPEVVAGFREIRAQKTGSDGQTGSGGIGDPGLFPYGQETERETPPKGCHVLLFDEPEGFREREDRRVLDDFTREFPEKFFPGRVPSTLIEQVEADRSTPLNTEE
jgi:hypothetical protein